MNQEQLDRARGLLLETAYERESETLNYWLGELLEHIDALEERLENLRTWYGDPDGDETPEQRIETLYRQREFYGSKAQNVGVYARSVLFFLDREGIPDEAKIEFTKRQMGHLLEAIEEDWKTWLKDACGSS